MTRAMKSFRTGALLLILLLFCSASSCTKLWNGLNRWFAKTCQMEGISHEKSKIYIAVISLLIMMVISTGCGVVAEGNLRADWTPTPTTPVCMWHCKGALCGGRS